MAHSKPPSAEPPSVTPLFFIGRDSHGHWVVQDQDRLRGGLFVDRKEALKYAMFENGHRPQAVVMVPGVFELDMSRPTRAAAHQAANAAALPERRAA
jgi:hypothetical protein